VRRNILPLIFITGVGLVGVKALFHPGLFSAFDIWHQVARLYHYQQAFADGQFPPYWIGTLAHGLGYPLFFFSYPLPWILGLPFLSLGFDIFTTIKILFGLSYVLSGVCMYFFVKDFLRSSWASLLVAVVYLWAPYRFLTIYVYGAMGGSFVFVFIPIFLWGVWKLRQFKSRKFGLVLTSTGIAGLILSHLMTLPSLLPLFLLFIVGVFLSVTTTERKGFLIWLLGSLMLGVGLSSFYLLPAIAYSRLTQVSSGVFSQLYKEGFPTLSQLIYSRWGYGLYGDSVKESTFSLQIGIAQWIAAVLAGISLLSIPPRRLISQVKTNRVLTFLIVFLVGFSISIFFMLDVSRPVWAFVVRFISLDYPTMFMTSAVFCSSVLGGLVFLLLKKPYNFLFLVFIILTALYTNRNHLRVNMYTHFSISDYVGAETTTNSFHEYLPKLADLRLFGGQQVSAVEPAEIVVEDLRQNTKALTFSVVLTEETQLTVKHFVFPGIVLYVDNIKRSFGADETGRIQFSALVGRHNIRVEFGDTGLVKFGKFATFASLLLLVYIWRSKRYA